MTSAFEHREVMRAAMQFDETRSVDQVLAEHKQRHDTSSKPTSGRTAPQSTANVSKGEMDKLNALLAKGRTRGEDDD